MGEIADMYDWTYGWYDPEEGDYDEYSEWVDRQCDCKLFRDILKNGAKWNGNYTTDRKI